MDTGLDAINTASKKVAQRAGKFLGNKITDGVTKSNNDKVEKHERVE